MFDVDQYKTKIITLTFPNNTSEVFFDLQDIPFHCDAINIKTIGFIHPSINPASTLIIARSDLIDGEIMFSLIEGTLYEHVNSSFQVHKYAKGRFSLNLFNPDGTAYIYNGEIQISLVLVFIKRK